MGTKKSIVLFESADKKITLDVSFDGETAWLSQAQMAELFATTKQNVSLHINNCFREGELEPEAVVKESLTTAADGKSYRVRQYNLDVIISVGYRVKSARGVEFRRWATDVLRRYIVAGHAENERRLDPHRRVKAGREGRDGGARDALHTTGLEEAPLVRQERRRGR